MRRRNLQAVEYDGTLAKPKDRLMIKTKFHLDVLSAVAWIGKFDQPDLKNWSDLEKVANQTSVKLVSELFGFKAHEIAFRVVDWRVSNSPEAQR